MPTDAAFTLSQVLLFGPPTRLDFKGTVVATDEMTAHLKALASDWPVDLQVEHKRYRTRGFVKTDSPDNVPYTFDGKPGQVCIGPEGETWVSVVWRPDGALPLRAWARARLLRPTGWSW